MRITVAIALVLVLIFVVSATKRAQRRGNHQRAMMGHRMQGMRRFPGIQRNQNARGAARRTQFPVVPIRIAGVPGIPRRPTNLNAKLAKLAAKRAKLRNILARRGKHGSRKFPGMRGNLRRRPVPRIMKKLKICSDRCNDQCAEASLCFATCGTRCQDVRAVRLCKSNCFINDCLSDNCTSCQKSCLKTNRDCRVENCATQCPQNVRRSWKFPVCKSCMTQHCTADVEGESDDDTDDVEPGDVTDAEEVEEEEDDGITDDVEGLFGEGDDVSGLFVSDVSNESSSATDAFGFMTEILDFFDNENA